jgi:CoA:oxalate CoA-transferase
LQGPEVAGLYGYEPLDGVRVVDLSHALAGPYCTMILGDLGADVIKVESPGRGDESRTWGPPFVGGESAYFLSVNRNKRSVVVNLKRPAGVEAFLGLCREADIVIENFAPGTADRLGVGYEVIRGVNAAVIYASISGYGAGAKFGGGYDLIAQGTSGVMSVTGDPHGPPTKVGVSIADVTAGMFTAHAVLAALFGRASGGRGCHIEVTLNDALLALHTYQAGRMFASQEVPTREGNHHPTIAPYGTFGAKDGPLNIAVGSDQQFQRLCRVLVVDTIAQDPRFSTNQLRVANRAELTLAVEATLREKTVAAWVDLLSEAGIPCGPILDLRDAFSAEWAVARGTVTSVEHGTAGEVRQVRPPWRFDSVNAAVRMPPPALGQHTEEVLGGILGMSQDEQAEAAGT